MAHGGAGTLIRTQLRDVPTLRRPAVGAMASVGEACGRGGSLSQTALYRILRYGLPAAGIALVGGTTLSCADLLGIPDAPRFRAPAASEPASAASMDPPVAVGSASGSSASEASFPMARVPDRTPLAPAPVAADAGPPATDAVAPVAPTGCGADAPLGESVPIDLLVILDNSGSMQAETEAMEEMLPNWATLLGAAGLDYRIILLSRHRTEARAASEAASTSICVGPPLSALESCPSPTPAPSARFFQYSVKIDATDSLSQALASFAAPDPLGLSANGWSEWLRPGALTAFVEVSDGDSELPAANFVAGLQGAAPDRFGADPAAPRFVFHSVVGLRQKSILDRSYTAVEPIETETCDSADTQPDNAGEVYQALSRLTGSLRFPLCTRTGMEAAFLGIAADLVRRSRPACPAE
jgi:hypothetical protein